MAIPDFQNEKEFRDKWIGPFLSKLGFIVVKNIHGVNEQGKDFYFAEYDRFGHTRVYAAQVKLGNIKTGKEISEILEQVKRCFQVPLRFNKTAHEQRIASVYVMTNGTISHTAKEQIHGWCNVEKMGENVFFLDGEQLDNKEKFANYQRDLEQRSLWTALRYELVQNLNQLKLQMNNLKLGRANFFMYRLSSLDAVLQQLPVGTEKILIESTESESLIGSIESKTLIDSINSMEYLYRTLSQFKSFAVPMAIDFTETQINLFRNMTEDSIHRSRKLITYCEEHLQELNEHYSLEITPVTKRRYLNRKPVKKKGDTKETE